MNKYIITLLIIFINLNLQAQSVLSIGLKGSLARFNETTLINKVGGFCVDTYNRGTKPMVQVYGRWQVNKFYLQPEFRYSTSRIYTQYINVERENPQWSYYEGIGGINLAEDLYRFDLPIKAGYFIAQHLSINAGIINTFFSSKRRSFYHLDTGRFHIADNVFDSQKNYSLGAIMGINLHFKRLNLGLDYNFPFNSMHNPVKFEGKAYSFDRKTRLVTFSVGYDLVRIGSK
ncbi:hypothetical protein [Siphonobacter sp.]|uniref:hypothetical protein n=1 Tax=Siphonobacter sp. TaxID=1869184 RepID=UPI003B3A8141